MTEKNENVQRQLFVFPRREKLNSVTRDVTILCAGAFEDAPDNSLPTKYKNKLGLEFQEFTH